MTPVARLTDLNQAAAPVVAATAITVLVNSLPAALVGSVVAPHVPNHGAAIIVQGSSTVLVESRPVAHVGSLQSCGHVQIQGSPNVFVPGA